MVPECRNRPEPVVNNQQYPFSSGVDDDRSRSKDEDSVETKISNSDDDRVGARKDLAHGLTARPHGQGVAPNYSLPHSVTHSHVACLVGLRLRLRPASNARIGMTSGGVAFNLQVVQVALLFDWRWNPTSERLSILCQTTFLSWKLPKNGTGVETLDFVRTIVVDSGV